MKITRTPDRRTLDPGVVALYFERALAVEPGWWSWPGLRRALTAAWRRVWA